MICTCSLQISKSHPPLLVKNRRRRKYQATALSDSNLNNPSSFYEDVDKSSEALSSRRESGGDGVSKNRTGGRVSGNLFNKREISGRRSKRNEEEEEEEGEEERKISASSRREMMTTTTTTTTTTTKTASPLWIEEKSTTSIATRLGRIRTPAGTKVEVSRTKNPPHLRIVIPAAGITGQSLASGSFAVVWNGFVGFWTVSALSAGGGLLMAAFSIPFWMAGATVAKSAFDNVFESVTLDIHGDVFSLVRTAGGNKYAEELGDVADITGSGARLVVASVTNDEPNVCLELACGVRALRFGSGLTKIELEYVAGEVNDFLGEIEIAAV